MAKDQGLTEAMEDYLEAILEIQESKGVVRVKDIAQRLGVRMPTVTEAVHGLVNRGLAHHERYEHVDLTRKGREVARETQRRHVGIRRFLTEVLGLRQAQAEPEACAMEHAMRPKTVDRLLAFVEMAEACDEGRARRLRRFKAVERSEQLAARGSATGGGEGRPARTQSGDQGKMSQRALGELRPGEKGSIVKVKGRGPARRRLLDMGLVPGADFLVERVAPLGDPVEIKVKGYHLSLRKKEAAEVVVEVAEGE